MPRLEKVYLKNNVMGLISNVSTYYPRLFSEAQFFHLEIERRNEKEKKTTVS